MSTQEVSATRPDEARRDESMGQLVKDLSQDISTLVRQELQLAKAEMTQKGKEAGVGAGLLGGAVVFGLAVVGGSMATIILTTPLNPPVPSSTLVGRRCHRVPQTNGRGRTRQTRLVRPVR